MADRRLAWRSTGSLGQNRAWTARLTGMLVAAAALGAIGLGACVSRACGSGRSTDDGPMSAATDNWSSPGPDSWASSKPRTVSFPLKASSNGRYLVDQTGAPFRVQGEASWDAHINLSAADLTTYLHDRQSKGVNTLFTHLADPVVYFPGSSAPWAVELGGRSAGVAALPFTKNASGGAWNGDPSFTNHDASFASPNDRYFAWVARFVDEAAARGMVVFMAPMYLGYGLGKADGWFQTLVNPANTQSVCFAFGQYLATGHGAFTGFAGRPNVIWVHGGDTFPPNGSEGALRALQILKGLQAGGAAQLSTAHWQHDYLTNDQTDFAPYVNAYAAYTHGPYPAVGPTYAESRALYAATPTHPTLLLETNYWGDYGATRAELRMFNWGAELSAIGGVTIGFTPFWGFATSPDGSTASSPTLIETTAWTANTSYLLNRYVSKGGNWYRATRGGRSGSTGPSGTGANIVDGTVTWSYASSGGILSLLDEAPMLDFERMGSFFDSVPWYNLVPSGLTGQATLITAGGGTPAEWSDRSGESGGMGWVASAATTDRTLLVAYVPHAHTGAVTVAMGALGGSARARWYDPTSGAYVADPSGSGFGLANTGTRAFTIPGPNASGSNDWALVVDAARNGDR